MSHVTRRFSRIGLAVMVLGVNAGLHSVDEPRWDRPETWAKPMGEFQGLSNFYMVSDQLYRGAQPEEGGFEGLKRLGIRTIVNLRTYHSDRKACLKNDLKYVHITVQAWEGEDEEVIEFLKVVTDPDNQPVFVHCQHGSDRTGVMSAVYRIAVQAWSREDAIQEMTEGGFGFNRIWQNLVDYVANLDVDRIKQLAGIVTAEQGTSQDDEADSNSRRVHCMAAKTPPAMSSPRPAWRRNVVSAHRRR